MNKLQHLGNKYSDEYYYMNLKDETFIHFTTQKRAEDIIKTGKILLNPPIEGRRPGAHAVFAISLTYGSYTPGVMKSMDYYSKAESSPIIGIIFKTNTMPKAGFPEEVSFGEKDVNIINASIVSKEKGLSLLKNSPEKISDNQIVVYNPETVKELGFSDKRGPNNMNDLSKMTDKLANKLEKQGLFKEAHDLDIISNTLEKMSGAGLSLMGSGETIDVVGQTKITNNERSGYRRAIGNQNYYSSVGDITSKVVASLDSVGLTVITPTGERWIGTLTGALSDGETSSIKGELVRNNQQVTNSMLILNIYKMDGTPQISYELNTYLS